MALSLFVSNRHEQLYEFLKQELFSATSDPFAERIITTSAPLRTWLQQHMATDPDLGIAAGMVFTREETTLLRLLNPKGHTPSRLELSLVIEKLLPQISDPALNQYLGKDLGNRKFRRRLRSLADSLAAIFERYGRYGGAFLREWPMHEEHSAWQKTLWDLVFSSDSSWTYPYHWLENSNPLDSTPPQVHLFCPTSLCNLYQDLFHHIAQATTVNLYLLSPCMMYWSDQLSGRERRRLTNYWQRKGASAGEQRQLIELLRDTNPLLAQLGRAGREMIAHLETLEPQIHDSYCLPKAALSHAHYADVVSDELHCEPQDSSLTLLQALQTDLLLLRNPTASPPIELDAGDVSIQLHATPSVAREVEILYDVLLGIMTAHASLEPPVTPADIVVLTPDLHRYAPYIRAVFGATTSQIPYALSDLSLRDDSAFIQSFLQMLRFAQSAWESSALLQILGAPYYRARHNLHDEDISQIRDWVQKAPIYWGEDAAHRDYVVRQAHCQHGVEDASGLGTWEYGLKKLLRSLAQESTHDDPAHLVNSSNAELLGRFVTLVRSLREDLRPLRDGLLLTLEEWAEYLRCLCDAYLMPTEATSIDQRDQLFRHLQALRDANRWMPDHRVPFDSIEQRLETLLDQQTIGEREGAFHCVRFSALRPHRSAPARVVALLGMEEGVFPRSSPSDSGLDLLRHSASADYCPKDTERDRALFLECILSARDHLILSYNNTSSTDGKEQHPCLPVAELMSYLNHHYRIGYQSAATAAIYQHPFYPFDAAYFSRSSSLKSYSSDHYRAAIAYQGSPSAIPQITTTPTVAPQSHFSVPLTIDLRDLETAVRDPLQLYVNKTLSIYLNDNKGRQVADEEPFFLERSEHYKIIHGSLREPLERVMARARVRGALPPGTLGQLAIEQLRSDLQPASAWTQSLRSAPQIQLRAGCREPRQLHPGVWHVPAICLGDVQITGTLDRVTLDGLLVDGKGTLPDAIKAWPALLLLHALGPLLEDICKAPIPMRLLALGKGSSQESFVTDPIPHLERLVIHYQRCLREKSPLAAVWVKPFLKAEGSAICTQIERDLATEARRFRYMQWLLGKPKRKQLQPWIEHWLVDANELYRPLHDHWFAKGGDADESL